MHAFIQYIIDFIFPPKTEELRLRAFSTEKFYSEVEKASKTEFTFIKAIFSYKNPLVRELIWQIKYKENRHALKCAGFALFKNLCMENPREENPDEAENILLIPIPISKKRRNERGYNQCELIIDEILKLDSRNIFKADYDFLIRTKHIEKQTFKNRNERIQNTEHIFAITKRYPFDTKIIIIDDVTTTGSTLREAYELLLKAGYIYVKAMTVAH